MPNVGKFIYIRHDENTWQFKEGMHIDRFGWRRHVKPKFIGSQDFAFYDNLKD